MKSLNKIIFINSAGINYGVVELCGNVLLTGTQGVGKSSILRAILFFYTADKEKKALGLRPEKLTFEEFYLPASNSYIVYEVTIEDFIYSIIVFKNGSRAAYRFIDAPFDPNWLVNEEGIARSDWNEIFKQLQGIHYSSIVLRLNEYRDILFGKAIKREMARYCIIGSNDYDNIIRSIQSVFLNDRIDSDFIRNTIISSLATDVPKIDLMHYRSHLKDFKREYEDIHKWYTTGKDGKIVVREQANDVVATYDSIIGHENLMKREWSELNFAIVRDEQKVPELNEEIRLLSENTSKLEEKRNREQTKMSSEIDDVKAAISVANAFVKRCVECTKKYEEMDIGVIEAICNNKGELEAEKRNLEKQHELLLQDFEDIGVQYQKLENLEQEVLNEKMTKLNESNVKQMQEHNQILTALIKQSKIVYSNINQEYEEKLGAFNALKEEHQQSIFRLNSQLNKLQYINPMQKELKELELELHKINEEEKDKRREAKTLFDKQEHVNKAKQFEVEKEDFDYNTQRYALVNKLNESQLRLKELENQLQAIDGSFYDWLETNVEDWRNNIGKIADEKRVLLSHELCPELDVEASPDTVFGVRLQIEAIESHDFSAEELRIQVRQEKKLQDELVAKVATCDAEHEERLNNLRSRFKKELSAINEQLNEINALLNLLPNRRQDIINRQRKAEDKNRQMIETQRNQIEQEINEVQHQLKAIKEKIEKLKATKDAELRKNDANSRKAEKEENDRYDKLIKESEQKKIQYRKDFDQKIDAIRYERNKALSGKGADTDTLKKLENDIKNIDNDLDYIAKNERLVVEYHKDMRDLIAHEEEKREELKRLRNRLSTIDASYQEKIAKLNQQIEDQRNSYSDKQTQLKELTNGLEVAKRLQQDDERIPITLRPIMKQIETEETCENICNNLRSTIESLLKAKVKLGECCRVFRSNFANENTFHFPENLNTEEGLISFASNVKSFVEEDKISKLSEIANIRYTDHLKHLAREVGNLTQFQSQVQVVVGEINRGLERDNFVTAIDRIEIRSKDSDSSFMSTLRSIEKFVYENYDSMGEANLFSGEDREDVNKKELQYLRSFIDALNTDKTKMAIEVGDTFKLQFRIVENGRDLQWQDRISNVGSDGTDILAKAMINIMLISVFMRRGTNGKADYYVHCMMDEIGKLHPENVNGILRFATRRNIHLINCSPMTYAIGEYRNTYVLYKDKEYNTHIELILNKELHDYEK